MKMKFKRFLPALLILILLAGCLAGTVFAAEDDYTPIPPQTDYMPDPRHPDIYVPPVYFGDGAKNAVPAVYHTTVEDAAAELRGLLEDRVTSIAIGFKTTSSAYDKRLEVFNEALVHTGVPTQGDYLAYQHGAFYYSYDAYQKNGTYYVTLIYDMTYYTTAQQEAQMDAAVDNLLDTLDVYDAPDYEKIFAVYDYMTKNIVYDYDGLALDQQTKNNQKIYTAYAALIDNTAVCQGYANLFYRLMLELGVDNRIISGIGNGGRHAWNIVQLDDLYYDVDSTWDASRAQNNRAYEYFLLCEDSFADHTRDYEFSTAQFHTAYPMSETDYAYNYILDKGTIGNNITWVVDSDYKLTISGSGLIEEGPWDQYWYLINNVEIRSGITGISDNIFGSYHALDTVTIPASVTSIDFAAFYACENLQTVIYGGQQKDWANISIGTYNDPLTNATILYTGEVKLSGAAPTLYENITINYKVNKTKFDALGISDPYLVVTFNGAETTITDYAISADGAQYIFPFYNIAPNQMNDTLTAVLYATYGGEVYASTPRDYSVAEYCYTQLSKYNTDAYGKFRTLLVDLLNYGAVSQQFTGYKTGDLVNASLNATQKGWASASRAYTNVQTTKYATISNPTVAWKGGGLVLNDAVVMRFKFETANINGLSFKIQSGAQTWTVTDIRNEDGANYVYFRGLNAGQMSDEVFITAYQNGVPVSNTVRYSIESYASQKIGDTSTAYLAELVAAMMKYGDAAKAYITP